MVFELCQCNEDYPRELIERYDVTLCSGSDGINERVGFQQSTHSSKLSVQHFRRRCHRSRYRAASRRPAALKKYFIVGTEYGPKKNKLSKI